MRVIVIDSYKQDFVVKELGNDRQAILKELRLDPETGMMEGHHVDEAIMMLVDEEGIYNHSVGFIWNGIRWHGNAVITQIDEEGNSVDLINGSDILINWWGTPSNVEGNSDVLH